MHKRQLIHLSIGAALIGTLACGPAAEPPQSAQEPPAGMETHTLPPEPVVTYRGSETDQERVEHGEVIIDVDEARLALHAQHHPHGVIETRRIPGSFEPPAMTEVADFALSKDDLVVINPGPGEYVHVMEGQRHGYRNLVVGITYTAPGGAPPMHTHLGEEIFEMTGPYVVNIPPMVPHSFQNLDDEVAELVVIFPTNVWEYDVLDYFPFADRQSEEEEPSAEADE